MKISSPLSVSSCTPRTIFKVSTLVVALSAIGLATTTKAAVSYDLKGVASYNTLGDLSIYQPPVGETKPTIMLMLDKSGSMNSDSLWNDYGSIDYKYAPFTIVENREVEKEEWVCVDKKGNGDCKQNGWEIRKYTVIEQKNVQYNYQTPNLKGSNNQPCYYRQDNSSNVQINFISESRTDDGQSYNINYCKDTRVSDTRTTAEIAAGDVPTNWRLGRMSALKVAVFKLLRNPKMDTNISIGAGSYGYNGGRYGKIGVAAKPLNDIQKNKLRSHIAALIPDGGTPIARAFAEAGAYVLGNNTTSGTSTYSGFLNTNNDGVIRNSNNYIKPESSQCAGTGIYMLTDGEPNNGSDYTQAMMRPSLNNSSFQCSGMMNNDNAAYGSEARWDCIGDYAKAIGSKGIKTAMVGFGSSFNVFDDNENYRTIQSVLSDGTPYEKKYYRCDLLTNKDAKNSCNLGMEASDDKTGFTGFSGVGGFGEGGFYYAKDSKDIVNSVLSFISKLDNDLASIPSGTITIPQDPLSAQNIQPYAYLPMLEPKVNSSLLVWPGNLKKYEVNQGTLYGKSATGSKADTRLYVNIDKDGKIDTTGKKFPADLNPNARDLWSSKNYQAVDKDGKTINANDRITAGGFYAQLKSPAIDNNSTRSVYVESGAGLIKVSVLDGKLVGFKDLDKDTYGAEEKLYLLSFLGYDINIDAVLIKKIKEAANQQTELETLITTPSGEVKVLGGVLHSEPTLVSYGGNINSPEKNTDADPDTIDADAGQISTNESERDDYIMFGSMEGALHIAKSDTGKESLAFIPKQFITNQAKLRALKENAVSTDIVADNSPVFGVDAPWTTASKYNYKFNADGSGKVTANSMRVYGGLSKGGAGLYGLDVSNLGDPKKLFTIEAGTSGYDRIGMVMSKPVVGKIKLGSGRNDIKEVLIFGGGYDKCYEDPTFKLNSSVNKLINCDIAQAKGNAVYIADANTGELIVSISGSDASSKNINVSTMKHSVVSEITTLDRDNDGLIDHLYFGDLGGQLYRVDLQNGSGVSTFVRRVSRVLNASGDTDSDTLSKTLASKGLQYRFYAQPSVSFFNSEDGSGKRIAVVNIASGDRSSPLSRNRELSEANRLFGIIDKDIVSGNLYGDGFELKVDNLTLDNLASLPFDKVKIPAPPTPVGSKAPDSTRANVIDAMKTGVFSGWSYPLTYFDGYSNIKHVKSMGTGLAMGSIYYMTAYSPEMQYDTTINTCSAQVVGGSERQLYCLPWGVCEAESSKNGTGGFVRAGKGIQELALGAFSKDFTNVQVLIGNQTFAEQVVSDNRTGYDARDSNASGPNVLPHTTNGSGIPSKIGGMGSGGIFGNDSGYKLYPQRWYEKSPD